MVLAPPVHEGKVNPTKPLAGAGATAARRSGESPHRTAFPPTSALVDGAEALALPKTKPDAFAGAAAGRGGFSCAGAASRRRAPNPPAGEGAGATCGLAFGAAAGAAGEGSSACCPGEGG